MNCQYSDIVIIGAGFSGIAAGAKLFAAGQDFLLLEARDRLGGRTLTRHYDQNVKLELGGQWIGPTQDSMYELAQKHQTEIFKTFNSGRNVLDLNQQIKTYKGLIPKVNILSLIELELVIRRLERMAKNLDTAGPWTLPQARKWDEIGLLEYLRRTIRTAPARKIIMAGLETVYGCDLDQLSVLHALFYIKSGTSLEVLLNIEGGAQQERLVGGMQSLAIQTAEPFKNRILTNCPVQYIRKNGDHYELGNEQQMVKAKHVVLALPPNLMADIRFEPGLPEALSYKMKNIQMGRVAKLFCVYEEPFWRADGFSGQVVADEHAPFQTAFDASPQDGSRGVLLAFSIGSKMDAFFNLDKSQRQAVVSKYFTRYFGPSAARPVLYEDHAWTDETWSRGCYAGVYAPGLWTSHGAADFSGLENMYWAGTESSDRWYGYIEGAVLAGYKAAEDILKKIIL
jgi:monoamine oxidase